MSKECFYELLIFLGVFSIIYGWRCVKKKMEVQYEEEEFDVNVYCKNRDRLIKLESNIDIYPVDAYINDSLSMQCKYCEDEDDGLPKTWNMQKRIFTSNVTEVELDMDDNEFANIFVSRCHSLIISHVQEEHMGLYFCKAPYVDKLEKSFNYLLDIMSHRVEEVTGNLEKWKNYFDTYLKPLNEKFAADSIQYFQYFPINITLYTDWSDWSECDTCSFVEMRYRIGRCRVKPLCDNPRRCYDTFLYPNATFFNDEYNTERSPSLTEHAVDLSKMEKVERDVIQFAIAFSCKGLLLKTILPSVYEHTKSIPDFILRANTTGACKGRMSRTGARYKRTIVLTQGAHLTLVCPDSTIDSDVRWEHNKCRLYPNEGSDYVEGSEEPRIYVDSFNTLYLLEVTEEEAGNYTCYVDNLRMQDVKLIILKRSVLFTREFKRHLNYLAVVFIVCFIVYVFGVIFVCVGRTRENCRKVPKRKDFESRGSEEVEEEFLLSTQDAKQDDSSEDSYIFQ